MTIRLATPDDSAAVLAIYAPIVAETSISFELEPPTPAEMQARIITTLQRLPWLVEEQKGIVRGYAYAAPHRTRAAYQWCVEVSVYIAHSVRQQGVGRSLYTALFAELVRLGYVNAYAGITLPNAPSEAFHRAMGFDPVGIYRKVGYKHGQWRDVGWWQRGLQPHPDAPQPPSMLQYT